MERGAEQRATGATKLNELSSRSHAVFIIIVEKSTGVASEASANDEQMAAFQGLHPGPLQPHVSQTWGNDDGNMDCFQCLVNAGAKAKWLCWCWCQCQAVNVQWVQKAMSLA